jgi:hypothetical protein
MTREHLRTTPYITVPTEVTHNKSKLLLIPHQLHSIHTNTVHGNISVVPITNFNSHTTNLHSLKVLTNNNKILHTIPIEIYKPTPTQGIQNGRQIKSIQTKSQPLPKQPILILLNPILFPLIHIKSSYYIID